MRVRVTWYRHEPRLHLVLGGVEHVLTREEAQAVFVAVYDALTEIECLGEPSPDPEVEA